EHGGAPPADEARASDLPELSAYRDAVYDGGGDAHDLDAGEDADGDAGAAVVAGDGGDGGGGEDECPGAEPEADGPGWWDDGCESIGLFGHPCGLPCGEGADGGEGGAGGAGHLAGGDGGGVGGHHHASLPTDQPLRRASDGPTEPTIRSHVPARGGSATSGVPVILSHVPARGVGVISAMSAQ